MSVKYKPEPLNPVPTLGQQVAALKVESILKDNIISELGQQVAQSKIDIMILKNQANGGEK